MLAETEKQNSQNSEVKGTGNHPNSRANLVPFQPGRSGNPGGRPKKVLKAEKILEDAVVEAAQALVNDLKSEDKATRQKATTEVLDRVLGKAKSNSDDEGGKNAAVNINIIKFDDGRDQPAQRLESSPVSIRTLASS